MAFILSFALQAQNMIPNGSFPSTTPSFTTNLVHMANCFTWPGRYCISADGWQTGQGDHSSPSDNTLKVDGNLASTTANLIWSESVTGMQSGVQYDFGFWVRPRTGAHTIEIEVSINGVSHGTFTNNMGGWQPFATTYTHGTGSTATIELRQVAFGSHTDCDIDDISLTATWPLHIATDNPGDMRCEFGQGKTLFTTSDYEYAAGVFMNDIDIYGTTLSNNTGNWLPWLARFDKNKKLSWTANITGTNGANIQNGEQGGITGIDVDLYGNTYMAGYFKNGSITFDGSTTIVNYSSSCWTGYLAKFNTLGKMVWVTHIETTTPLSASATTKNLGGVKVNEDGTYVYMTGSMENWNTLGYSVVFPPNTYTSTTGDIRGYFAEFDASTGANTRLATSASCIYGIDFELNATEAFIGGHTDGIFVKPFLSKLDLGTFTWGTPNIGTTTTPMQNYVVGWSVALTDDYAYLGGFSYGTDPLCFNSHCTSTNASHRGWVAQFDLSLTCVNLAEIKGNSVHPITVHDVIVDVNDVVYVTGETDAETTYYYNNTGSLSASTNLISGAIQDLFIAKYDTDLRDVLWVEEYGGNETDCASGAIAFNDAMGGLYFSGYYKAGGMGVGPKALGMPKGTNDYFMARIDVSNGGSFKKNPTTASNLTPSEIDVFPNPVTHTLYINIGETWSSATDLTIYDLTGQEVLRKNHLTTGTNAVRIDVLTPGIYVFRITDPSGTLLKSNRMVIH